MASALDAGMMTSPITVQHGGCPLGRGRLPGARWRLVVALVLSCSLSGSWQRLAAAGEPATLIPGYAADVAGDHIDYNSADPDVRSALLVRSLDRTRHIEWDTAPLPQVIDGDFVTFVWLFGIDASPERHHWDLLIDGEPWFRFANPARSADDRWHVDGRDGARLTFRGTFVDRHDDLFGYAVMRLPAAALTPGQPLRLRIAGESADSRIWTMTFRAAVQSGIAARQLPAVVRHDGRPHHVVVVKIDHMTEPRDAVIDVPGGSPPRVPTTLEFGGNLVELRIPEVHQATEIPLKITIAGRIHDRRVTVSPVRPWQLYLVQHTHTDIGYTRPQTEILPEHVRYIDYALDFCDQTDTLPDDARFRWTCEGSWAVREFLRTRPPEQIERFKRRVDEGRIEVTALFMNMSEITDESTYATSLQPLRLFRKHGLAVTTAMQNDVNGAPWCLVDYFGDIGVKYVTMGQHGHRALIPFDVPTAFWWESPAGRRVLAFRADHYNTGNFWGVHNGVLPAVEREVFHYLEALQERNYPFDHIAVQHSGYFTDNSPPSTVSCGLVARWNDKYVWPRLRNATAREFLQHVETHHAASLAVHRVAWPDWWTDGTGSAARETAAARVTQVDLAATQSLLAMDRMLGSDVGPDLLRETQRIGDALLFYGEHTFGAAESIREPLVENAVVQWAEKSAYAWEAVKSTQLLQEAAMGLLQAHVPKSDVPTIIVVNTLNWRRSGLHEVYIDHEILPPNSAFRIVAPDDTDVAAQPLRRRPDGTYWGLWLDDVPAFGFRTYRIEVGPAAGDTASQAAPHTSAGAGLRLADAGADDASPWLLENAYYRLKVDPDSAAITSLFDKQLDRELVDPDCRWQLGQFIHETLGNRSQLEQFRLDSVERATLDGVKVHPGENGPIWRSLWISGDSATCHAPAGVKCEIRLYHAAKLVELHYAAMKKQIFEPEGIYVAFPLQLPGGRIVYEAQGGTARPDLDLLPGTASDWQTMQNFSAVRGDDAQVLLSCNEVPLMQFGGINLGRFEPVATIARPHMFSWVMNNYWTTNFRASQQGEFKWRYRLTSQRGTDNILATRFGWGARVPLSTLR